MSDRDDRLTAASLLERFEAWRRAHPLLVGGEFDVWWNDRVELGLVLHGTPSHTQANFRIRNADTVALNSTTFSHALNTNATITVSGNTKFRIRFEVEETTGNSSNETYHLYVSKNGGAYTRVTNVTSNVRATTSAQFTDGDATTNVLAGSARAFVAGVGDASDAVMPSAGNITLANQHTELEICLEIVAADVANNDTLDFRIRYSNANPLATYTNTPRVTVSKAALGQVRQENFRIRSEANGSVALNSTSWSFALGVDATLDVERRFRIRFLLKENGTGTVSQAYKLQYRINAGTWTDVHVNSPGDAENRTATNLVEIVENSGYADAAVTTQLLGAGSFVAGRGKDTSITTASITLTANQETELEYSLWIHKYADGAARLNDGDTVQFRIVTSAGAVLAGGYGTADTNIPQITANWPAGLIGGTMVENPHSIGPFADANGNLYTVIEPAETDAQMLMMKSTDGGVTWFDIDTANNPVTTDLEGVSIVQSAGQLEILHHPGGEVRFHVFRTSDHGTNPDTWGTVDTAVITGITQRDQACALIPIGSGDLMALFTHDATVMKVGMRKRLSGTWDTATTNLWDTSVWDTTGFTAVPDGTGLGAYVFAHDDTNGRMLGKRIAWDGSTILQDLFASTVAASATGTVVDTNTGTAVSYEMNHVRPIRIDATHVFVGWVDATSNDLEGVVITVGSGGSVGTVGGVVNDADNIPMNNFASRMPVADIVRDAGVLYAYFARETVDGGDSTLWRDQSSDDGDTWGTNVDMSSDPFGLSPRSRINMVRGHVITHSSGNGGNTVVALVYDDANPYELDDTAPAATDAGGFVTGSVWYTEFELPAGAIDETGRLVTIAATISVTDAQRYVEATSVTVAATVSVTDAQRYVEATSVSVAATVSVTDAQRYVEATSVSVAATISVTDARVIAENVAVAAAVTVTASDLLAGQTENVSVTAAATVTVTDVGNPLVEATSVAAAATVTVTDVGNPLVEATTVTIAATISVTDQIAAITENVSVTIAATVSVTDAQRYVDASSVTAAVTVTVTDVGNPLVEATSVTAAATVTVTDVGNPLVEATSVAAAATISVTDQIAGSTENVSVTVAATISVTDAQRYVEALEIVAAATVSVTDQITGQTENVVVTIAATISVTDVGNPLVEATSVSVAVTVAASDLLAGQTENVVVTVAATITVGDVIPVAGHRWDSGDLIVSTATSAASAAIMSESATMTATSEDGTVY